MESTKLKSTESEETDTTVDESVVWTEDESIIESVTESDTEEDKEPETLSIEEETVETLEDEASVEIPDLPKTGQELSDFVLEGWELMDSVELDFNEDGITDYVGVLENQEAGGWLKSTPRILFAIESSSKEGYRFSFQDANLIRTRAEGGIYGDPYLPMTADKTSFTTYSYGGSAWRWAETDTYTYKEGTWYLTASADIYGYEDFITSYEENDWEAGVGIRQERCDDFSEMEKYWDGEKEGFDIEYEIVLDEPITLYQAGMRWWLAPDRRTDWSVASIGFADGVTIPEDRVRLPDAGIYSAYNDENCILYISHDENSENDYLTMYTFADQSLYIVAEEKEEMEDVTIYKDKIYYTTSITEEITYKAIEENAEVIKQKEDRGGMVLNRMNLDGTQKEAVFEYRFSEADQEGFFGYVPYLSFVYEISGDEIVMEVYIGYGKPHPFYRMNLDGSGVRQIGQVPNQ